MPSDRPSASRRAATAGIFGTYLAIATALTWPLVARIGTGVPNDLGDPVLNTWILWWNAVTVPLSRAWWNAPAFFPAEGVLTFSEHLLGLSPISTPIFWATGNIQLGYNVALFLSFPLSAFFGYLLCKDLTGRRDAAFVGGLLFGFTPYRIVQLPHIQVLCSYWMPITLLGLHRYLGDRRARWLALFGGAWLMQALCNGYYLVFLSVLVAVWLSWFVPWRDWRVLLKVLFAWGLAALPLVPIVLTYRRVHAGLGLRRSITEILIYSADISSLADHSGRLAFWHWLPAWHRAEGELFPGITAILLIAIGVGVSRVRAGSDSRMRRRGRIALAAVAALSLAAAAIAIAAPFGFSVFGLRMSVTHLHKPMTLALIAVLCLLCTSPRVIRAWRSRSLPAFYALAAGLMWLFSLGPKPTFLGIQALYQGPYAWLLHLPGLDTLRTPARFHMITILCLSCAAAIAFSRIVSVMRGTRRGAVTAAVCALALVDTWIVGFPVQARPDAWPVEDREPPGAAVVVPLGGVIGDAAAMYRSMRTGHPVVNGYSGHRPPAYRAVELGLSQQDPDLLQQLGAHGVTSLVLDTSAPGSADWLRYLAQRPDVPLEASDGTHLLYRLPPAHRAPPRLLGAPLRIAAITTSTFADEIPRLTDEDVMTWWESGPQRGLDYITIDLGKVQHVGGVELSVGPHTADIPVDLSIERSDDGQVWTTMWHGSGAGPAFRAAFEDPVRMPLTFDVGDMTTRFVRLREIGVDETVHWTVAELRVLAPPGPSGR